MRGRKQRRTQEFLVLMCALFGAALVLIGIAADMIPV